MNSSLEQPQPLTPPWLTPWEHYPVISIMASFSNLNHISEDLRVVTMSSFKELRFYILDSFISFINNLHSWDTSLLSIFTLNPDFLAVAWRAPLPSYKHPCDPSSSQLPQDMATPSFSLFLHLFAHTSFSWGSIFSASCSGLNHFMFHADFPPSRHASLFSAALFPTWLCNSCLFFCPTNL